jgi:TolB-like protein/DNA-binding winged helix-turn-helix (wHTH) protein
LGTHSGLSNLVRFADFELDLNAGVLRRGSERLKLQPQPAKILVLLVSRAGSLVTRQELAKEVWGAETYVDFEQGLNFAIRQVRTALEDDADEPRFIQTVPKQGYRFIGDLLAANLPQRGTPILDRALDTASQDKRQQRFKWLRTSLLSLFLLMTIAVLVRTIATRPRASGVDASAIHQIRSLAVLPLHNLSGEVEQEYFSDGMTDELITELAKIGGLRVISHTSVERYKSTKLSVPEIARALGVDDVLEGSVLKSGNKIRVTSQLIDARTDHHVWADSYERDDRDVLALQSDLAQRIAVEVGVNLTNSEQTRLASNRTVDPAAHDAYLRGNFYWNKLSCGNFEKALRYFQEAAAKDPGFAPAQASIAFSYFNLADWACWPQQEAFEKSRQAAQEALRLDPDLADAHAAIAELAFYRDWDWTTSNREFQRAIALDPNDANTRASFGIFLIAMGQTERGLSEFERAHQLDPVSEFTNMIGAYMFYLSHRFDQAIDQGQKAIELYPQSGGAHYWLAQSYEQNGMAKQAADTYLKTLMLANLPAEQLASARQAIALSGLQGYWQHELLRKRSGSQGDRPCWKTLIYAHLGDKERTIEQLQWGLDQHCDGLQFLKVEPIYDRFRPDPRFQELLQKMRLDPNSL